MSLDIDNHDIDIDNHDIDLDNLDQTFWEKNLSKVGFSWVAFTNALPRCNTSSSFGHQVFTIAFDWYVLHVLHLLNKKSESYAGLIGIS